jgi:lantibiotic modifying enzyme
MDDTPLAMTDGRWVETAEQIGRQIVDTAIWHEGRCNWIGAEAMGHGAAGRPLTCYRALDAALYSGAAGVSAFLAHLHVVTGNRSVRDVALGGLRQALAIARRDLPRGLFTGAPGVALNVRRAAELLDAPALAADALSLADAALAELPSENGLLDGAAGEAIAFLRLATATGRPRYAEAAMRLGEGLLAAARPEQTGWSWPSAAQSGVRNLTGFSHGAAGVAYAFLLLYQATGGSMYCKGAQAAFAYERAHYDTVQQNWPDFRELNAAAAPGFPVLWCHGAAGIALSRLAGWRLLGDERCREEARVALVTTRTALRRDLEDPPASFCLCHGTAGNADVLLAGASLLGEKAGSGRAVVEEAARMGQERYQARGSWPCGVPDGQSPSLMLGLAGIGMFFLRLNDQALSTPLAP